MQKNKPISNFNVETGQLLAALKFASKNKRLLNDFLVDLLTPQEYKDIVNRWQIIKLLKRGLTQRDISKKLRVSIATVTRGSRAIQNPTGGFNKIIRHI